jgi:hypothetical protein
VSAIAAWLEDGWPEDGAGVCASAACCAVALKDKHPSIAAVSIQFEVRITIISSVSEPMFLNS